MWFVERARVDSPFGKLTFHLPGTTVLEWFQRAWRHEDPEALMDAEIGGGPYGFDSIFEAIGEHDLPCPRSLDELRDVLLEHLWVEGDHPLRLDERGLRVRTDDDEVDLAYYFLEDEAVIAHPGRLSFLVHGEWPLPSEARVSGASGPGAVHAVRITWQYMTHDGTNLDNPGVTVFPGTDLPGFAGHLRAMTGPATFETFDADLLRGLVGPGDAGIGPALDRYAALDGYDLMAPGWIAPDHEQILEWKAPEPPPQTLVAVDRHLAQVARHIDDFFGYEQLFLFDDHWAASHPDLAASLIRYASHWDPFEP